MVRRSHFAESYDKRFSHTHVCNFVLPMLSPPSSSAIVGGKMLLSTSQNQSGMGKEHRKAQSSKTGMQQISQFFNCLPNGMENPAVQISLKTN